jgi:hypothetical protein
VDPRNRLFEGDGTKYLIWDESINGPAPEDFAYKGKYLSTKFHEWNAKTAECVTHLVKRMYNDLGKATKAPANVGDPIANSVLSTALEGNTIPRYAATRVFHKPSTITTKTTVYMIVSDPQEMKSCEIVAQAFFSTVILGKAFIIFVLNNGGKAVATPAFKKEVEDFNELTLAILNEKKHLLGMDDYALYTPKCYAYSDGEKPEFQEVESLRGVKVKTDKTMGEYWQMRTYKYMNKCPPIMIVCTKESNVKKFMKDAFPTSPMSFTRMMGSSNGFIGGVKENPETRTVDVSIYAPHAADDDLPFDDGENRPTGCVDAAYDEADVFFGNRNNVLLRNFVLQQGGAPEYIPDHDNGDINPMMFEAFSASILVTATPADILLPSKDMSHIIFKVFKIDTTATYICPGLDDCPFTNPNDPNRTFISINGSTSWPPNDDLFLAARRDGAGTLNQSDTIMVLQNKMIADGTWAANYSGYSPMVPNSNGRISVQSYKKAYEHDANAPYEEIHERAKVTKFHADRKHNMAMVLERLQYVPFGVDPRSRHRSCLVVNENTKHFNGQLNSAYEMLSCRKDDGTYPADSVVFSCLVIEHGVVFLIKEHGAIDPVGFIRAVSSASRHDKKAGTIDKNHIGFSHSACLSQCALATVARDHSHDVRVAVDGAGTLYRHTLENDVSVLYMYYPNAENVVTLNFGLLPAMYHCNRAHPPEFFNAHSGCSVVKLVTIGGAIFSRGVRAKDKEHRCYLTDMWPSFQCSDRFSFPMVACVLIQLGGRLSTVLNIEQLAFAKETRLVPTMHIDKANWTLYSRWILANRQLMRVFMYDFNVSGATTALEHMAYIIANPPADAGTSFSALASMMSHHIGETRGRNPRLLYAPMTRLGVIEDEVRADVREEADLPSGRLVLQSLVDQHTAELVPGLHARFARNVVNLIPNLSRSARFIMTLETFKDEPQDPTRERDLGPLRAKIGISMDNTPLAYGTIGHYLRCVICAIRARRFVFTGEDRANLAVNKGTVTIIPTTLAEISSDYSLSDSNQAALNFGTVLDKRGDHTNGGKKGGGSAGVMMVVNYIKRELEAGNNNPFD